MQKYFCTEHSIEMAKKILVIIRHIAVLERI